MLLSQYLPPSIVRTRTFTTLLSAEQLEIDGVNNSIQDIINQCFVTTATWGLAYWEDLVGIVTDPTKDVDYRRSAINAKLKGAGTATVGLLQSVASSFSNGQVTIIEHPSSSFFEIKFIGTIGVPPNMTDLQNTIEHIKPAHLAVTYTFLYTQWSEAKATTWATLKTGTWDGLKNGGVI